MCLFVIVMSDRRLVDFIVVLDSVFCTVARPVMWDLYKSHWVDWLLHIVVSLHVAMVGEI